MGVHGLWNLIEPSGKVVPLDTLENKVLAVDVSIWLHQAVKGFQDSRGSPLPNAHLLGLFHRICKLLFYKIKPVFVFDGGVPALKKQTVAARQQKKSKAQSDAERLREKILTNLIKHKALNNVLGKNDGNEEEKIKPIRQTDDLFHLPPHQPLNESSETRSEISDSFSSEEESVLNKHIPKDLHSIDVKSDNFRSLPADVRHEILTELKETRKQSSWGRLHEMPKESGDFSSFQMNRLLKRRSVQVSLEQAEKEIGGHTLSLREMEEMLKEHGVDTSLKLGNRIASDNTTRYIYIKEAGSISKTTDQNVPEVKDETFKTETKESDTNEINDNETEAESISKTTDQNVPEVKDKTVKNETKESDTIEINDNETGILHSFEEEFESDWISDEEEFHPDLNYFEDKNLNIAKDFIFENSGLTQKQILKLIQAQRNKQTTATSLKNLVPQPSTSKAALESDILCTGNAEISDICKKKITSETSIVCIPEENNLSVNSEGQILHDNSDTPPLEQNANSEQMNHIPDQLPEESDANFGNKEFVLDIVEAAKSSNDVVADDTSTDSDMEFVEVSDEQNIKKEKFVKENQKSLIEVVIKKDDFSMENDIFADVFTEPPPLESKDVHRFERSSTETEFNLHDVYCSEKSSVDSSSTNLTGIDIKLITEVPVKTETSSDGVGKQTEDTIKSIGIMNILKSSDVVFEKVISAQMTEQNVTHENVLSATAPEKSTPAVTQEKHITTEELQELKDSLSKEQSQLLSEKGKQERLAANITEQMNIEAQELLQLFGIPYVLAPMEAEAQCAFLDAASLTDGTITDDSDIWLFGGQTVYKNFFNQKKHVLQFKAAEIQRYFKLTRRQLIVLALLVGSDYTVGLPGVGPVTALEILATFPCGNEETVEAITRGLRKFREWLKTGKAAGPGKTALRTKLKDIRIGEGFPNTAVVEAYVYPQIDHSKDTFTWSMPDLQALRNYTRSKFGWTHLKTDEIVLPVIKKLNERNMQKSIASYFKTQSVFRPVECKLSKRVQKAVDQINRDDSASSSAEDNVPKCPKKVKGEVKRKKNTDKSDISELEQLHNKTVVPVKGRGRGRNSKNVGGPKSSQLRNPEKLLQARGSEEFILQREKDKLNTLKAKLKAIEVYRTSKLDQKVKTKRRKLKELKDAKLSESSSDE